LLSFSRISHDECSTSRGVSQVGQKPTKFANEQSPSRRLRFKIRGIRLSKAVRVRQNCSTLCSRLHVARQPNVAIASHSPRDCYALTWNLTSPDSKKPTIWFAAATPALLLASKVWAPIFFFVKITRFPILSPTTLDISSADLGATSQR